VTRLSDRQIFGLLALALLLVMIAAAGIGAMSFSPPTMIGYLFQDGGDSLGRNVFLKLRLPRVLLCGTTGAVLGLCGALMQGLFRNPIVEPGLTGISAGAALGAALSFVFGVMAAPLLAFAGACATAALAYRLAGRRIFALLLAGIAINAACNAGTGLLSFIARDPQARNITFWSLGTFTTATWRGAEIAMVALLVGAPLAFREAGALNALMLGEDEAASLGVHPRRLILRVMLLVTVMVSAVTAMVGVIAFIGLVVPHLIRLVRGADHHLLLPSSALLGAILMEVIDIGARLVIRPAELPVGIIAAFLGAPLFLWLLSRKTIHD
jgi:iron complex transport system permease protein